MKKLFLFIGVVAFSSCEKCATCVRTWHYSSYQVNQQGSHFYPDESEGATETFSVCDGDAIDNAEKTITTHQETKISNSITLITDGKGECDCDEN